MFRGFVALSKRENGLKSTDLYLTNYSIIRIGLSLVRFEIVWSTIIEEGVVVESTCRLKAEPLGHRCQFEA